MKYAKTTYGYSLHLVKEVDPHFNNGRIVSDTALCGLKKPWVATYNMPFGRACLKCIYAYRKKNKGGFR